MARREVVAPLHPSFCTTRSCRTPPALLGLTEKGTFQLPSAAELLARHRLPCVDDGDHPASTDEESMSSIAEFFTKATYRLQRLPRPLLFFPASSQQHERHMDGRFRGLPTRAHRERRVLRRGAITAAMDVVHLLHRTMAQQVEWRQSSRRRLTEYRMLLRLLSPSHEGGSKGAAR